MKILVAGTFCSGKSTLAAQINSFLINSHLIEEIPREILKINKNINWELIEIRDYLIVRQLIVEKKSEFKHYSHIIIDSGIVGNIAHDWAFNIRNENRKKLISELGHSRYDIIFICDHREIEIIDDGERSTNEDLRNLIYEETILALKYLEYDISISISGSKEERLKKSIDYIKNMET